MTAYWITAVVGLGLALVVALVWGRSQAARRIAVQTQAVREFEGQRSRLAKEFLSAAAATGKPRGLRWKSSDLGPEVLFAVDRVSGELYGLAAVTIAFEAIEGGGMEDVEAVGNLRSATAVFVHRRGDWTTDGRTVFNLEPQEALARYNESLRPLAEEPRQA